MLALSDAATTGLFGLAVAIVGGAVAIVTMLMQRNTRQQVRENADGLAELLRRTEGAERREDEAKRREDECLEALAWVVEIVKAGHDLPTPMPPAVVRAMARHGAG